MINIIKNRNKKKNITTFLNPFSYVLAKNNKAQLSHFNIEIDGGLLVKLLNLFGISCKRKSFDMTSLAPIVFNAAIEENKTIYFIGTKLKLIDLAINNIQQKFPELNICGFRDGYLSQEERDNVFADINNLEADYVICGMGTPLQEQFLLDLKETGWKGSGYTCGGFLHQTANGIKYYPHWINQLGLRAFYRMYDEPTLIKRYFIDYPKAIVIIIYDILVYKFTNKVKESFF
ncbi:MAG TPA: glycosyltransferase [Alphaproteobacteria bacterium]|nr:glycosyltransferase [Alphaproteobacteria bacterium]